MESGTIPQGVVAVFVSKDGAPIVSSADFNATAPGGFTREEAQRHRVKSALALKVVRDLSSVLLSDAVPRYDAEQILDRMCQNGCKVVYIPVGYDEA